ncbi:HAD-IC family P-type ATPase [Desemzia sp. FAM 24101]|uniref:HAD-IC family P-type ATPase n=1 Tax=unclassified Desemzia TaxID=2685243 RepID=UPI003886AC38
MKWYAMRNKEVMSTLTATQTGLSGTARKERLENRGKNKLTEKAAEKLWQKVGKHFTDLLMIILIVAGILKGLTGSFVEMVIIFIVVLINGFIGYYQERKAAASLDGLKKMSSQESIILSGNQRKKVETETLVPGDIVLLQAGDIVPADIRLIEATNLLIEESALTGESLPIIKDNQVLAEDTPLGDQINMAFLGTLVQEGSGVGVVATTGDETQLGQINQALQTVEETTTPLVRKINQLNHQIFKGLIAFIIFLLFFATLRYGMDFNLLLAASISLIVAIIPEGLPAVLTMILSMGVKEMAEEKAIIKSMPAVETLGSITVICSDKTGTLTKNEMTVVDTVVAEEDKEVLYDIMHNCQDLKTENQQEIGQLTGNPTELALLKYVDQQTVPLRKKIDKIPFSSTYKLMATLHEVDHISMIYVKGAPDVLLHQADLTPENRIEWLEKVEDLAKKGQRVLGFAKKESTDLDIEQLDNLTFIGIAGIMDPPKESAIEAVADCSRAGISVKMITGDHKDTAQAIGKEIGLNHTGNVLEGSDIDQLTDTELAESVQSVDIYARTTPQHKLRIVQALQQQGEIVGMTGDGVNDAPALKQADIGIAMGIKGSEVSKQAADMVLADDNFATISKAVKEGRRIFANLKKTINFFLPTALAQGLIVILALLANQPLPLSPIQILWVNMVTTITLSYALGFEKASDDLMSQKPRNPKQPILTKYNLFRLGYVSVLITMSMLWLSSFASTPAVQQTILVQGVVLAQAFYMVNCREELNFSINRQLFRNKALGISLLCLVALQSIILFVPSAQAVIGTTDLSLIQHLSVFVVASQIFFMVEIEKAVSKAIQTNSKKAMVK